MKTSYLLAFAALATGCCLHGGAPKDVTHIVPASFESREAAAKYASGQFAGGAVDVLKVGKEEVLVVSIYGSGVPDIAIAAYLYSGTRWDLAAELRPPVAEIHKTIVESGAVVVVGGTTGKKIVLLKPERPEANQRPEGTPGKSSPSKPSQVPVVPHP